MEKVPTIDPRALRIIKAVELLFGETVDPETAIEDAMNAIGFMIQSAGDKKSRLDGVAFVRGYLDRVERHILDGGDKARMIFSTIIIKDVPE